MNVCAVAKNSSSTIMKISSFSRPGIMNLWAVSRFESGRGVNGRD